MIRLIEIKKYYYSDTCLTKSDISSNNDYIEDFIFRLGENI